MEVSENGGTPKSSMFIGFSVIFPYKPYTLIILGASPNNGSPPYGDLNQNLDMHPSCKAISINMTYHLLKCGLWVPSGKLT